MRFRAKMPSRIKRKKPYDGDDMQVHLMYHFTPIETTQDTGSEDKGEDDDSNSLSSISAIVSLSCIIAAAIFKWDN